LEPVAIRLKVFAGWRGRVHKQAIYWTRLGARASVANQIGRGALTADLGRELGDFAIGNTGEINAFGPLLTRTAFSTNRSSPGWVGDVMDSPLRRRTEPLVVPERTRKIRVSMSSRPPDTTGCWVIDHLALTRSTTPGVNLWPLGDFGGCERLDPIGGTPSGWGRRGTEPVIAREFVRVVAVE
jgi:hypothetical protein